MKKAGSLCFLLIILIACISWANDEIAHIEKEYQRTLEGVTREHFKEMREKIVSAMKSNELYVARRKEGNSSAYYYGCDGQGRRKIHVTMAFKKGILKISMNVLIEGPVTEKEANNLADILLDDLKMQLN